MTTDNDATLLEDAAARLEDAGTQATADVSDQTQELQRGREALRELLGGMTTDEVTRLMGSEQARVEAIQWLTFAEARLQQPDDAGSEEDDGEPTDEASPLETIAAELYQADADLEDRLVAAPPFIGIPSAQTTLDFLAALVQGDDTGARAVLHRHCDASFVQALREIQRRTPYNHEQEPRHEYEVRTAHEARTAVQHGALLFARLFSATALEMERAHLLTVAHEAGANGTRAQG